MPTPNETRPRQFRLTEETMADLEEIATRFALGSRAAAIRYAVKFLKDALPPAKPKRGRPKGKPTP